MTLQIPGADQIRNHTINSTARMKGLWRIPKKFSTKPPNFDPKIEKTMLDKTKWLCYNNQALEKVTPYRGVEQLVARRAHNPEVVGSSPASATKIVPESY